MDIQKNQFEPLRLSKKDDIFQIHYYNGVYLGDIIKKEDGYYDFWPEYPSKGGCWPSYALHAIAKLLDALNEPYEKQVDDYFKEQDLLNSGC